MAKRRVVIDLYEEVMVLNHFHTAEIEIDVDDAKDTLGVIESKALVDAKSNLPEHIQKRVDDSNDELTIDKINGKMRL